jgi:TolA-binding protein
MDDARLQGLLRAAGRSETSPLDLPLDLADRVRRLRDRRRRTRTALGGLLATAVLLAGITWMVYCAVGPNQEANHPVADHTKPPDTGPGFSPRDAQRLRAEIAQLAAEARQREQAIEEMTRRQRLREETARLERQASRPDPLEVARIEIEKTAFLMIDHAQQQPLLSPGSSAAEEYRRVLERFPGTKAARNAEKELRQLNNKKGQ